MTMRTLSAGFAFVCLFGASASAGRMLVGAQVAVPGRPSKSIVQSEPGTLRPLQVSFNPQTRIVTITLSVEDPNGYFIPNLHRENFAVYEDGVLQRNATVDIEHAPVSLSVLVEGGGRYQEVNKVLNTEIPLMAHLLLDALVPNDKVTAYAYADTVKMLVDSGEPHERLDSAFGQWHISGFSESNLYDALIEVLNRTRVMPGRRAVLLISTGIDSFSRATFDDVIARARGSDTPVYCIGLAAVVEQSVIGSAGPLSKIDWNRANRQLETLATVTDGRTYLRDVEIGTPAIYDDFMEHLRVRYVITYTAPDAAGNGSVRRVRVALVDPRSGGPIRIVDAAGKAITARISTEASYSR
jgi:Ca-activated chloride channel family protein